MLPAPARTLSANDGRFNRNLDMSHTDDINQKFFIPQVNLIDEFDILQIVGEGWFGKILLTEHRSTQTEMVLKALPKAYTGLSDFFREFHYGLHLAAHRNIITTYDVAFETAGFYVFSQEYAPLGDLTSNVTETGLGELHAKRVARQLAAAVHHIHSRELVHRDIKLDNILVFRSDFSRIKLCDFGETRRVNTIVRRHNEWLPYSPPEVLQINTDETYKALTSHDVWQFGIVLFVCLTGCLPWQKAALDDPRYTRYLNWHNATLNIAKKPKLFQLISSRAQRIFKRLLDPKAEKRLVSVLEINKYLEDRWLAKLGAEKALNGGADERDELCPSMYSFHSSLEEKNQLLYTLTTYGIETTVDRAKKKDRIREWIEASAIIEENEEDESDINECIDFQELEDKEPVSMRGRHFPEMHPPRKETSETKRRKRRSEMVTKRRPSVKPVERKIPFAPQVAEERETIARFASFPNGDPSLAMIKKEEQNTEAIDFNTAQAINGNKIGLKSDSTIDNTTFSSTNINDRIIDDSLKDNGNTSRDSSVPTTSGNYGSNGSSIDVTVERTYSIPRNSAVNGKAHVESPQIPTRKYRAQTTPFSDTSTRSNEMKLNETTKRSQSINTLITTQSERLPLSDNKVEKTTNQNVPSTAEKVANDFVKKVVESPNSLTSSDLQKEVQSIEKKEKLTIIQATNPLTKPIASHLVMQSLNALQSVSNTSLPPEVLPSHSMEKISSTQSKQSTLNIDTFVSGKDVFEHYGIAQGVIIKAEAPIHRGSSRRSVNN
ncbi:fatty acyl-CoA synthetase and RNA processing-associated kinase 1 isoform X1 [Vespula maculifrons]|uniref:Fatty acyl-CoA synthetase and RNA processing-associated kinase 1 isoform X1 n=1 Tax=Vespula maculifrons TaxID=7453 RepID=A0ABD2BJ04_VESMC